MNENEEADPKKFVVRFGTMIDVSVTVEAADPEDAEEVAWPIAQGYLDTLYGNNRNVVAAASIDGIGPYEVEGVSA